MSTNATSPPNHSSLLTRGVKVILALIILVFLAVWIQKTRQPRYEDRTMDEWLRVFVDANEHNGWHPDLSLIQQQAVEAFTHFGQDGFDYLTERGSSPMPFISQTIAWLNQYKPIRELGWFQKRDLDASAANHLRGFLRVPYEWIEHHIQTPPGTDPDSILKRLRLMQSVTNHLDELVPTIAPLMSYTNRIIPFYAMRTLNQIYERGGHYPEIEPYLISVSSNPGLTSADVYTELLTQHAQQSSWGRKQLEIEAESSNINKATRAILAMMHFPEQRETATRKLTDRLQKAIHAPGFRRPDENPDVLNIVFELGRWEAQMDPVIQPILMSLLMSLDNSTWNNEISEIFLRQGWQDHPEILSHMRKRMIPRRGVMGSRQLYAFDWLLARDPEDEEVWREFDKVLESTTPSEVALYLRELGDIPRPSRAAIQRLEQYTQSDRESHRLAATQTLAKMKEKGLLNIAQ